MEQQQGKPRVIYQEFLAKLPEKQKGTVAWVIETFIRDTTPTMKQIGGSQMCILRVIQRSEFGKRVAAQLKRQDVIEFVKWLRAERPSRRGTGHVCAATASQYVTYLYVALQTVADTHDDCESLLTTAVPVIKSAKRRCLKMQLIGPSTPRTRIPAKEEIDLILAKAEAQDKRVNYPTKIKLLMFTLVALESTRRQAELCRLKRSLVEWNHVDNEGKPAPRYMIEAVKHPTRKATNHRWFPLTPELGELLKLVPEIPGEDRYFPYNPKSVSQAYARLTGGLNIDDLVFHDNRRGGTTKWLIRLKGNLHLVSLINGDTMQVIEKHYIQRQPEAVFRELPPLDQRAAG